MYIRLTLKKIIALLLSAAILWGGALLAGLTVNAKNTAPSRTVSLPILMYHSVCVNKKADSPYVITPEAFEDDLQYLKNSGYTTVFLSDAAAFVRQEKELPEKPVVLSFDDGFYNFYSVVLPLLEKYDMKANLNVVGSYADEYTLSGDKNPAYAYLSWADIVAAAASGRAEIGSHSYAMHSLSPRKGVGRIKGETDSHYRTALTEDFTAMNDALSDRCGVDCKVFAYPFGELSDEARRTVRELGFTCALTCDEHINRLTHDPAILLSLGRINRNSRIPTLKFMKSKGI